MIEGKPTEKLNIRRGITYAATQGPENCSYDDMNYSSSNPEIMLVHVQSYSDDVDQLVTK